MACRLRSCVLGLLLGCLAYSHSVAAQARYPSQPIKLIVPFSAGGDADTAARLLVRIAKKVKPNLQVNIDIVVGQSGATGSQQLLAAKPDGYTLMLGRVANQVIAPVVLGNATYKPTDFSYFSILEHNPMLCGVRNELDVSTLRDLGVLLRKAPGQLRYATAGVGSAHNLAMVYLLRLLGQKPQAAQAVHFQSSKEANDALLSDKADMVCNNAPTLLPLVKEGKIRALFTNAPGRLVELPDLPTASEIGIPNMAKIVGWSALVGPAQVPAQVRDFWKQVLRTVAKDPEWIANNGKFGGLAAIQSKQDPLEFVNAQWAMYEELAVFSGVAH